MQNVSLTYKNKVFLALIAIAAVGTALIGSQKFVTGSVINGGMTQTPTATDLVLTMPAPLNVVDKTTLTLKPKVRNNWSEKAETIVVHMILPPGLTFDAVASEKGCTVNDQNIVTCPQIMYLGGNQERTLTVRVKVDACKNIQPPTNSKTLSVWTIATTSTEDVNTATNIQQNLFMLTCASPGVTSGGTGGATAGGPPPPPSASTGDLYITKSATPTRSHMALGGTLSDEVLRLTFRAEKEDIDVTDLVFTATGPNAASISTNVDRIELFKVGSTTPFASATIANCGSTSAPANSMCAKMDAQEFVAPKGLDMNLLARLRVKTDVDGSVSGQQVQLMFGTVSSVVARGLTSSNLLSVNDGDALAEGEVFIGTSSPAASQTITGKDNAVVHSKIMSITNASPDANGTAIPTGIQRAIGQFKFSAAAANNTKNGNNSFTLSGVIFNVNATNVLLGTGDQTSLATSDFKIYSKLDPTMKSTCTADKAIATDALVITCSNLTSSLVNTEIDPDSDVTFVLEAEVVNAKISNTSASTLQVSFQNFDSMSATTFGAAGSHVRWLDKDNASSPASFLWIESSDSGVKGTSYNG